MPVERAGDSQNQVVPRLVLEQEWSRGSDERTGALELLDDHCFIV
jgi:hypothetical protein